MELDARENLLLMVEEQFIKACLRPHFHFGFDQNRSVKVSDFVSIPLKWMVPPFLSMFFAAKFIGKVIRERSEHRR